MKKINFSLMVCVLSAALIALNFPAHLQAQCTTDAECNDGVFCNGTETCDIATGNCVAVSACPPSIEGCVIRGGKCDEENDVCVDVADNSLCDNGNIYNGIETCDIATGECQPGFTPFKTDLIAGGGGKQKSAIDVGDVLVWNDAENLYVKYIVTAPWCLTETHLQVATSLAMIPQKKGSPIPGQFDLMHKLSCAKEDPYVIPLESFKSQDLYIAAHAVVARKTLLGIFQYLTAWGAGFPFPSRNWATYFTYTLQCTNNAGCPTGSYCEKTEGDCSGAGVCEDIPIACPDIWDPVCGCDGNTYPNACKAQAAGVSVDQTGSCACTTNADCPSETYCSKAEGDCSGTGSCVPPALACPNIWDPVCGCDGNTYQNSCYASWANVSIDHIGSCGCITNTDCPAGTYCNKAEGDCSGTGSCVPPALSCPDIWEPVCGCDGNTYQNSCFASWAEVSIANTGSCACSANADCPAGTYCNKAEGDCSGTGSCVPPALSCPDIWDPVCGCDGNTYQNSCYASWAEVSVANTGSCACSSNTDCPSDSYCEKPEGDCFGTGFCERNVPSSCLVYEWEPVCGCDGTTYQSPCYAAAAGVSIASTGSCWCSFNSECPDLSYCKKLPGDCGGIGLCEIKPLTCPVIWDPVCGCDGTTYQSECDAAGSGVSINYNAECST